MNRDFLTLCISIYISSVPFIADTVQYLRFKSHQNWLQVIKQSILAKELILNIRTILIADDQVIVASREDELQRAAYTLKNIAIKYNLKISVNKTKAMAMRGEINVRTKIVINNNIIEQVNSVTSRPIARQRLGKHIPEEACARNNRTSTVRQRISKQAFSTIEGLCFLRGPC
jgi:hypothetical protein